MRIGINDETLVFQEGDTISTYTASDGTEMVAVSMTREGFMRLVEQSWHHDHPTYETIRKALNPQPPVDLTAVDAAVVKDLIAVGRTISAIRYVRGLYNSGLKEAKYTVDWYRDHA